MIWYFALKLIFPSHDNKNPRIYLCSFSNQDCHDRAWDAVSNFIQSNLSVFAGKTSEAESVLMPKARAWLRDQVQEYGVSHEDHTIFLMMNMPTLGIVTGAKESFIQNFVTNVVAADFPLNSICLLVHPNRAGQSEGRTGETHAMLFLFFLNSQ